MERLLDPDEAAAALGIQLKALHDACDEGIMGFNATSTRKSGRRFNRKDLVDFFNLLLTERMEMS